MKDKSIQFEVYIADDAPTISLDTQQIERVFINLLSNAIKFTPENGKISIDVKPDNEGILCKISDTGIGIKEADVPKLFDEFYRVDNELNLMLKGTGLGLALVKNIIEAHGGKIWVTSKLNEGTTFHFTMPLKREKNSKGKKA